MKSLDDLNIDTVLKAYNWTRYAVVALAAILLGLILFVQYVTLQEANNTTDKILDCTTPGGKCYKAGTARSSQVVRELQEDHQKIIANQQILNTYITYCSHLPGNNTIERIEICVNKELEKRR